jgi:hypothetical protein
LSATFLAEAEAHEPLSLPHRGPFKLQTAPDGSSAKNIFDLPLCSTLNASHDRS